MTLEEIYETDPAAPRGIVYFIESAGRVKIGYTTHLGKRLADLNTSSPTKLTVMDYARADKAVERMLHAELASERVVGEWFRLSDKTQDLLFLISDFLETFDDNEEDTDGRDRHILTVDEVRDIIARPYHWVEQ